MSAFIQKQRPTWSKGWVRNVVTPSRIQRWPDCVALLYSCFTMEASRVLRRYDGERARGHIISRSFYSGHADLSDYRARREIPLDFEALAEIPVEHFGLIDDYGVLPKHPSFRHRVTRQRPAGLAKAGKSKRDEPDIGELYYDDVM
ncbi:protein Frey 1 [Ranitomeya imitator]|uniref:protein Frey 1 n=1 Tax=Ranitomeya imitator TaxID=111125 RepID=UPI0037E940BD